MHGAASEQCLDERTALRCLSGEFSKQAELHLDSCRDCRRMLLRLAQLQSKTGSEAEPLPRRDAGDKIDRYILLEELGRGGMGVVMRAYDPVLDRKLALKLVKPTLSQEDASDRLLLEAQTIARITHPNVIPVHDAGRFEDQVFVAMSQVEGPTLRGWLEQKPRSASAIVGMLIGAGEGLAAAHAAGIVHGDFKPQNVLVDAKLRPLVTDFGLARWVEPEPLHQEPARSVISGTPGYIAPEQYAGAPAGERSDQFAFCVSLFEALSGRRPFLPSEIEKGQTEVEPGALRGVPRRVRAVLLRGLQTDPQARFPSMRAMLDALSKTQKSRLGRWFLIAACATVALSVVVTHRLSRPRCVKGAPVFDRVWGPARVDQLRGTLAKFNDPYTPELIGLLNRKLSGYKQRLLKADRDACEEESTAPRRAALRRECLRLLADEADLLIVSFLQTDAAQLRRAPSGIDALTRVAECENASFLAYIASGRSAQILALQERLFESRDAAFSNRSGESMARAREVRDEAKRSGLASIAAKAALDIAELHANRGRYELESKALHEALFFAEQAKHDLLRAEIMIELASVSSNDLSDFAQGDLWLELSRAILENRQDTPELISHRLGIKSSILLTQAKGEEALEVLEQTLSMQPPGHPQRHQTLLALGDAHALLAHKKRAADFLSKGLAGAQLELGTEHPLTGTAHSAIADYHLTNGEQSLAAKHYKRALSIWANAGVQDAQVAMVWSAKGQLALDRDDFSDAARCLNKALQLREALYDSDHPDLGSSYLELADLHSMLGEHAKAIRYAERGVATFTAVYKETHIDVGAAWATLGEVLLEGGKLERAQRACSRAMALIEPKHPVRYLALHCSGQVSLAQGRAREAVELFQEDHRITAQTHGASHWERAFPLIGLARAHVLLGALESAETALLQALALLKPVQGFGAERAEGQYTLAVVLQRLGRSPSEPLLRAFAFYEANQARYPKKHRAAKRWLSRLKAQGLKR